MVTVFEDGEEYVEQLFTGLEYTHQVVTAVTFDESVFKNCNFSETQFKRCTFRDCQFENSDLSLVTVEYSSFLRSKFEGSKLIGINWAKISRLQRVEFRNCNMSYATFMELDLQHLIMTDCLAKETTFAETNLSNANFAHTDFSDSRFVRTNLTQADFRGAKNYFIPIDQNILKKTKFSMPEALSLLDGLDIILDNPVSK
jgi:uncharacterized protein YjbI with pentapeptide repeats